MKKKCKQTRSSPKAPHNRDGRNFKRMCTHRPGPGGEGSGREAETTLSFVQFLEGPPAMLWPREVSLGEHSSCYGSTFCVFILGKCKAAPSAQGTYFKFCVCIFPWAGDTHSILSLGAGWDGLWTTQPVSIHNQRLPVSCVPSTFGTYMHTFACESQHYYVKKSSVLEDFANSRLIVFLAHIRHTELGECSVYFHQVRKGAIQYHPRGRRQQKTGSD